MFPDILLLENHLYSFISLCVLLHNLSLRTTTESNLKPDKSHSIYSQTIFSVGGNFSKLPTVLGAWVGQRAIILCFGPKFGPKQGIIAR